MGRAFYAYNLQFSQKGRDASDKVTCVLLTENGVTYRVAEERASVIRVLPGPEARQVAPFPLSGTQVTFYLASLPFRENGRLQVEPRRPIKNA